LVAGICAVAVAICFFGSSRQRHSSVENKSNVNICQRITGCTVTDLIVAFLIDNVPIYLGIGSELNFTTFAHWPVRLNHYLHSALLSFNDAYIIIGSD